MSIQNITVSNTYSHWLNITNLVVDSQNKILERTFQKSKGTLYIMSPSTTTGLYVANNTVFTGNIGIIGSRSSLNVSNASFFGNTLHISTDKISISTPGNIRSYGICTNTTYIKNSLSSDTLSANVNTIPNTYINSLSSNTIISANISSDSFIGNSHSNKLSLNVNSITANSIYVNGNVNGGNIYTFGLTTDTIVSNTIFVDVIMSNTFTANVLITGKQNSNSIISINDATGNNIIVRLDMRSHTIISNNYSTQNLSSLSVLSSTIIANSDIFGGSAYSDTIIANTVLGSESIRATSIIANTTLGGGTIRATDVFSNTGIGAINIVGTDINANTGIISGNDYGNFKRATSIIANTVLGTESLYASSFTTNTSIVLPVNTYGVTANLKTTNTQIATTQWIRNCGSITKTNASSKITRPGIELTANDMGQVYVMTSNCWDVFLPKANAVPAGTGIVYQAAWQENGLVRSNGSFNQLFTDWSTDPTVFSSGDGLWIHPNSWGMAISDGSNGWLTTCGTGPGSYAWLSDTVNNYHRKPFASVDMYGEFVSHATANTDLYVVYPKYFYSNGGPDLEPHNIMITAHNGTTAPGALFSVVTLNTTGFIVRCSQSSVRARYALIGRVWDTRVNY